MQRHIIEYIRRPDTIDGEAIAQLQRLVQEHPYFHVARILLLQGLYRKHDPAYDETLRRTAILVPSREAVFRLTEEPHYTQAEEQKRYDETADASESRTVSLIDTFLEAQTPASPVSHPIDASQDYIGYILQRESQQSDQRQEALPMNGGGVVEDFLENEHGRIVLDDNIESEKNEQEKEQTDASLSTQNNETSEILTEIMAGIYIKQGKYENAVKIIRQLSLKYPKKNRYFADQIRFLEKLIINNKHK
ncbi:MAG: tetratricopeptide repeat protein [Bacteroidaceae bacterium]|nr:tetratricopeptide repeat protein [Bacteroidaceae bacterium]